MDGKGKQFMDGFASGMGAEIMDSVQQLPKGAGRAKDGTRSLFWKETDSGTRNLRIVRDFIDYG